MDLWMSDTMRTTRPAAERTRILTGPQRFCGWCGAQIPPGASFCTSCGRPVAAAAPPPPTAPLAPAAPSAGWSSPEPAAGRGRRWVVVGAVLAVLVVVGAGIAAVTVFGGSDGDLAGGGHLATGITSEPEKAWTFDTDGEYAQVSAAGDTTIVSVGDSGGVIALDKDGDEIWSADDSAYGYAYVLPDDDDLVLVQGFEDYGLGVLSTDDGEQLWFDDDGGSAYGLVDGGLVVSTYDEEDSTSEIAVLDPRSGDEKWSISGVESSQVADNAIYVVKSGDLISLDPSSGDEKWSVDVDLDDGDYPSLAAVDGIVAVATDEVRAYSAEDGDALWSEDANNPDASLTAGAFSSDSLYINESVYSEDLTEERARVFDEEGEVGDLENRRTGVVLRTGLHLWRNPLLPQLRGRHAL